MKNSWGFTRLSRTSARAGRFLKLVDFFLTWVAEWGCLYFLFCFIKPFRRLMLYNSYKYDSIGLFQKPLILCKKAMRKHFKSWVIMVSVLVNHKVYHFSWENQPSEGTKFGRIPPTLNDFDLGISNGKVIRQLIGFWWLWGCYIIGVIRASHKVVSRPGPCCTFRVCCCLLCVNAALWVVQWAALPVM